MAKITLEHFYPPTDQSQQFRVDMAVVTAIATGKVMYGFNEPLAIPRDFLTITSVIPELVSSSSDGCGVETEIRVEQYELDKEMRKDQVPIITNNSRMDHLEQWSADILSEVIDTIDGGNERVVDETGGGELIVWLTSVADSGWSNPTSSQPLLYKNDQGLYVFNRSRSER